MQSFHILRKGKYQKEYSQSPIRSSLLVGSELATKTVSTNIFINSVCDKVAPPPPLQQSRAPSSTYSHSILAPYSNHKGDCPVGTRHKSLCGRWSIRLIRPNRLRNKSIFTQTEQCQCNHTSFIRQRIGARFT